MYRSLIYNIVFTSLFNVTRVSRMINELRINSIKLTNSRRNLIVESFDNRFSRDSTAFPKKKKKNPIKSSLAIV